MSSVGALLAREQHDPEQSDKHCGDKQVCDGQYPGDTEGKASGRPNKNDVEREEKLGVVVSARIFNQGTDEGDTVKQFHPDRTFRGEC